MPRRSSTSHVTTSPRATDIRDIAGDSRVPGYPDGTGTFLSCGNARAFENSVLQDMTVKRKTLSALMKDVLYLCRVAKQPDNYPDYRRRPTRPLQGGALTKWVGGQVGLPEVEVKHLMEEIDRILELKYR